LGRDQSLGVRIGGKTKNIQEPERNREAGQAVLQVGRKIVQEKGTAQNNGIIQARSL